MLAAVIILFCKNINDHVILMPYCIHINFHQLYFCELNSAIFLLAASQQDWAFWGFFFVVVFFSMRGLYNYHSVGNEATGSSTDG